MTRTTHRGRSRLFVALLGLGFATTAQAWYTVVDGDKGKLEIEPRIVFEAISAENQAIAGQTERVNVLPMKIGPSRLQLAARYEDFDSERDATTNRQNTTVGTTYYIKGHAQKIQLDYTWHREDPSEVDNDELRLAVVAAF